MKRRTGCSGQRVCEERQFDVFFDSYVVVLGGEFSLFQYVVAKRSQSGLVNCHHVEAESIFAELYLYVAAFVYSFEHAFPKPPGDIIG